jgi:glucose-6-phosphate 1-dehydrogenase
MSTNVQPDPSVLVIFGAAGDLTWRKLIPALYNLFAKGWLPDRFSIVGVDRKDMSDEEFRQRLQGGVDTQVDEQTWNDFASHLRFLSADFSRPVTYQTLSTQLDEVNKEWAVKASRVFLPGHTPLPGRHNCQTLGRGGFGA